MQLPVQLVLQYDAEAQQVAYESTKEAFPNDFQRVAMDSYQGTQEAMDHFQDIYKDHLTVLLDY